MLGGYAQNHRFILVNYLIIVYAMELCNKKGRISELELPKT